MATRFRAPEATSRGQVPPPLDALLPPWCRSEGLGYPALMPAFICTTCGTQYPPSEAPPAECPVCLDPRQYIGASGQEWTTLPEMQRRHWNAFRRYEPDLFAIGSFPQFAIGQRAFIVRAQGGNVL